MVYYSDLNLELSKATNGDIKEDQDIEAVKNSVKNIAETIQGHRVMMPSFAINAYNLLFEPVTYENAEVLAEIMWESIERWDSRVEINNIHVEVNIEKQEYKTFISFSAKNITLDSETVVLTLKQL